MNTLIKNGTLITASETFQADILVEDEKISLIGRDLSILTLTSSTRTAG